MTQLRILVTRHPPHTTHFTAQCVGRPYRIHRPRGAMVALIAVCIPVMLVLAAFCINLCFMELTRTELRVATDAATRAAGRQLALTGQTSLAIEEGMAAASRNTVAGQPFALSSTDFEFGESIRTTVGRYSFTAPSNHPNAVRVLGARTSTSVAGRIPLVFGRAIGVESFQATQSSISTQIELDVAIVIDRSGSMAYGSNESTKNSSSPPAAAPDGWTFGQAAPPECRWRDLVAALDSFLNNLSETPQTENVALVTYSSSPAIDQYLTDDYSAIMDAADVHTQSFAGGSTGIGYGIEQGIAALDANGSRIWAVKAIVVMTDGIHNTGTDPIASANQAGNAGITLYTITFSNEADQAKMKQVAKKGKGQHFHADTSDKLIDVFKEVARSLPTLLTE